MHVRTLGTALAATVLGVVLLVPSARSDDRGVVGKKLVIIDKLAIAGKAKLVFVAKDDTPGAIHKGPAADPALVSGAVSVFPLSDVTGNRGEFSLANGSDGAWLVDNDSVAKYVNKAAGPGTLGVKVAVVKPDKVLKVVAKTLGDGDANSGNDGPMDLDPSVLTAGDVVRVVFTITVPENGASVTHRMCADFSDLIVKPIGNGTGTKVLSKTSTAPTDCGDFTSSTTTTTISSTTTTTLAGTCDPFTQNCPTGQGCYPTLTSGTVCLPAGTGGEGTICYGVNDCDVGLFCYIPGLAAAGPCVTICQVGGAATCPSGSSCTPYSGDVGFCSTVTTTTTTSSTTTTTLQTCDPLLQDCSTGQGCYFFSDGSAYCYPAGTGTQGSACTYVTDCATGFECLGSCYTGVGSCECLEICNALDVTSCPNYPLQQCYPSIGSWGGCF